MKLVELFLLLLICTTTTATATPDYASRPNLVFLSKVNRLGNSNYVDCYFSCNVTGEFILWHYNNLPLGRVDSTYGTVVSSSRDFDSIVTLLSSTPDSSNSRQAHLSSVMVLSFRDCNPKDFTVQCSSRANLTTVHTVHTVGSDVPVEPVRGERRNNGSLAFDYVLSSEIVTSRRRTHVFICGVSSNVQILHTGDQTIGFSRGDGIGFFFNFLSPDRSTVVINGILIDRDQFLTTSLLLISDDSDVTVSCYYDVDHFESLSSNISSTPTDSRPLPSVDSISGMKSTSSLDPVRSIDSVSSSIEESLIVYVPASVSSTMSSPTSILKSTGKWYKLYSHIIIIF